MGTRKNRQSLRRSKKGGTSSAWLGRSPPTPPGEQKPKNYCRKLACEGIMWKDLAKCAGYTVAYRNLGPGKCGGGKKNKSSRRNSRVNKQKRNKRKSQRRNKKQRKN